MGTRGTLRIYLGAAPGVGKTFAMLGEGQRRAARGTDVVIGFVETHGRPKTATMAEGLETVPRREITYREATFTEMDVDAVIARAPQVALIDELAHTNVPGSRNEKRWEDIDEILDAGIHVISTVNVQHLESVNDVVEQITGVPQRETVPDEVVRRADQVDLVDMSPEALRRRMAHGNVYPSGKVDAALANYFRPGNLTALRELALLWLADKVDDQLERYRADHRIESTWEARERVVVALSGGPEGETLIRRGARIAARSRGADILAVYVAPSDGLTGASPANLARQRTLVESLGGTYHQVMGDDIPNALLDFARGVNATQLVLGASRRGRLAQVFSRGVGVTTTALSGPIDVHLVTHAEVNRSLRRAAPGGALTTRRRIAGFVLAAVLLPLLTWPLASARDEAFPSALLLFLGVVVGAALTGGLFPALLAAVGGFLLLNFFFTEPYHTFAVSDWENLLALVVFVFVAAGVSAAVDLAARRTRQAAHASAEAATLSAIAGSVLRGERALPALLEQIRETFGPESVTLLERRPESGLTPDRHRDPASWRVVACVGEPPCASPDEGEGSISIGDDLTLVLRGRTLEAADRRVLEAFAAQAAGALSHQRLEEEAGQARRLAEGNKIRTALLAAVSHDLRTPLASIKASVSSLRQTDVTWDPADEAELLATIEESADRLNGLIANLLDMSRLQTGAVTPLSRSVGLEEVVPLALAAVPAGSVKVEIPEDLGPVLADAGLLERALANVVENAARHSDDVLVTGSELRPGGGQGRVEIRVADHGPGVPDEAKEGMFAPFQRLGDAPQGSGVGLGLAVARGFAEAMDGTLHAEDTPGGGLTLVFTLPSGRAIGKNEGGVG